MLDETKILTGLNPEQKKAVEHDSGPLLILAGAGSGKTKTLTHRIAYLIAGRGISPYEILAVTFTNKAAGEMRERLASLLNQDPESRGFMPWMGTFHSISVRILRQFGENIEIPKNFVILDETDRLSLVKSAMRELHITDKQFNPRTVASMISSAKNNCMSPDEYYKTANMPIQQVVAEMPRRCACGKSIKGNFFGIPLRALPIRMASLFLISFFLFTFTRVRRLQALGSRL